jgi:hypothetical protein
MQIYECSVLDSSAIALYRWDESRHIYDKDFYQLNDDQKQAAEVPLSNRTKTSCMFVDQIDCIRAYNGSCDVWLMYGRFSGIPRRSGTTISACGAIQSFGGS